MDKEMLAKIVRSATDMAIKQTATKSSDGIGSHWNADVVGRIASTLVTQAIINDDVRSALLN